MSDTHSHASASRSRLLVVCLISLTIGSLDIIGAMTAHSLSLFADAGHVATDLIGLGLVLGAIWLGARPAAPARSFGFLRTEILAALANAVILAVVGGLIIFGAIERFGHPAEVQSSTMLVVAIATALLNGLGLLLLRDGSRKSLGVKSAYLEVLGDLAGSISVIIAAIVIGVTGFVAADAIASLLIGGLILARTVSLAREAIDILIEASPHGLDMDRVREHILEAPGVIGVHDLHAWTITSGVNVLSAHVIVHPAVDQADVLDHLCRCLAGVFDVEHSTFQIEVVDRRKMERTDHA